MEALIEQRKPTFALRLFEIGAVKFGSFRLKLHEQYPDAPESPFYLDLRTQENPKPGPLTGQDVYDAADLMFRMAARKEGLAFTHIAGVPNAGDPFAMAFQMIAYEADEPARYELLRLGKQELPDDKRRIARITEGSCGKGDRVLMVDDLITQADSKLEAMDVITTFGPSIAGLVVLVDREQGGAEKIVGAGYHFVSVYTFTELMTIYETRGFITADRRARCLDYKNDVAAYIAAHGG